MGYFRNSSVTDPSTFQENVDLGQFDPVSQENLQPQEGYMQEGAGFEGQSGIIDHDALLETMIIDMISQMPDDMRKAYCESDEFANLCEAGVVGRKSITRLNKQDDFTRRLHLAALQKAKEDGAAEWEALRKNRVRERQLREKIFARYEARVRRDAQMAQKRMMQLNPRAFSMLNATR